jgi:hypothetical protein
MLRTKHLVVAAAFMLITVSTGGIGTLAVKTASSFSDQSAAVMLGTPLDHYAASVADVPAQDGTSFADRIRDTYVPRVTATDTDTDESPSPNIVIDTPLPSTTTPTPEQVPATTIEEESAVEASAPSSEESTASTTTPPAS